MLSILPITFFVFVFLIFLKSEDNKDFRWSFLSTSILWGTLVTVITELLSIFRLLSYWGVAVSWLFCDAIAIILLIRKGESKKIANKAYLKRNDIHAFFGKTFFYFDLLLMGALFVIVLVVGITGWISPPNNWDSMTYHMSRVVHWIQNKGIIFYPTSIPRQLYQNPWAEFAILQFQILGKTDRFANLVQWFSMIGCALGSSLLAKKLGAKIRGQIFAAIFSMTIPMGILQGSSTQNDYVVSFWLVCLTYFGLVLKENTKLINIIAVGISLGLAVLTKATAYIYAFPLMVWISLELIKSFRVKGILQIILVVTIALTLNFGHFSRNYNLSRTPLGPDSEYYSNEIFTPKSLISNIIRNIALHMGTSNKVVNDFFETQVYQIHSLLRIDPNDKGTTFLTTKFHINASSTFNEDVAGNPLHLGIILLSIPIIFIQNRTVREVIIYQICLLGGVVIFCFYLRWQPWNSRLHLPLFILWAPLIGLSLSQIRWQQTAYILSFVMLFGTKMFLLNNSSRPIFGPDSILSTSRTDLYFMNRKSVAKPYVDSARFLLGTQCSKVGLMLGGDDWEYPFWVLLNINEKRIFRMEHVNVSDISKMKYSEYPFNNFSPCAVIVNSSDNSSDEIRIGDGRFSLAWKSTPLSVYMLK